MEITLNSILYECWHEAGHAVVCLIHNGRVDFMEIIKDENLSGRARARCETTDVTRPFIACGGFAAEYFLYKSGMVNVITDQCSYHKKTYKTLHTIEHRLHLLTQLAFITTGLAVIGHFVIHAQWLLIFTAALPAFAAGIHGIVTMNEMGRVSQMSKHTHHQLVHLLECISRLDSLHFDDARFFIQLRNITHEAASVMSNVNRQWQDLIEHQATALPA